MADTALRHTTSDAPESGKDAPLHVDRAGFALLHDRLREANTANPHFDRLEQRLLEDLHEALRRLEAKFADLIDRVVADGDWARYGIDLRNLPFDDVLLLIVVRQHERPFSLYWEIADRVFADLRDDNVIFQFRLATKDEWEADLASARQRGVSDALGIPLLARVD